jgi:hypothetical protein
MIKTAYTGGTVSGPTVTATCVSRPTLSGPSGVTLTSLNNINFNWTANSPVADQYVLEISVDDGGGFSNRGTGARSVFVKTLGRSPAYWNSGTELANSVELRGLTGTHTIYWRVGCRRAADTLAPAAYPPYVWEMNNPKNTRWIYSTDYCYFTVNL